MGNMDMRRLENIQAALDLLPADKQEYIVGYAEGVLAMGDKLRAELAAAKDRA